MYKTLRKICFDLVLSKSSLIRLSTNGLSLADLKTAALSSVIRQQYKNGLTDEFMSTTVNEKVSMTFKSTLVKPEIITTIENGE